MFIVSYLDMVKVFFKFFELKFKYFLGGLYRMLLLWLGNGCLLVCYLILFFIKYYICLNLVLCVVFLCLKVMVY